MDRYLVPWNMDPQILSGTTPSEFINYTGNKKWVHPLLNSDALHNGIHSEISESMAGNSNIISTNTEFSK